MIEIRFLIALTAIIVIFAAYKFFMMMNKNNRLYQSEIERVLNSDEFKVKGRFEE